MFRGFITTVLIGVAVTTTVPAFGQAQQQRRPDPEQLRMRNQIAIMETALKQAVRSGAGDLVDQLKTISFGADGMLLGEPEALGFPLASYGTVFYVRVPQMNSLMVWALPVLAEKQRLQAQTGQVQAQTVASSRDAPAAPPVAPLDADIAGKMSDLPGAYRRAITTALIDAMLYNGGALRIPANEFLTVAARRATPPDPLNPSDDVRTTTLTVKGSDLEAFQQKRITHEEGRKLVIVRED